MNRIRRYIGNVALVSLLTGAVIGGVGGFLTAKAFFTPRDAMQTDINNDGKDDLIIRASLDRNAILYGVSEPEVMIKQFVSGKEFNPIAESEFEKDAGRKRAVPYNYRTRWTSQFSQE